MYAGPRRTTLVQIGAGLGIAANCIGWLIFCLMCAGFGAAVYLSLLPVTLAAAGMLFTIIGANTQKHADIDTHVLAAIFINLFGIVGGLLEMAAWCKWTIFAH